MGFPKGLSGKEFTCQCRRQGFDPWVGTISWRRKWQPAPVFLPRKFHGQKSLAGCNPQGHKESQSVLTTEQLSTHTGTKIRRCPSPWYKTAQYSWPCTSMGAGLTDRESWLVRLILLIVVTFSPHALCLRPIHVIVQTWNPRLLTGVINSKMNIQLIIYPYCFGDGHPGSLIPHMPL